MPMALKARNTSSTPNVSDTSEFIQSLLDVLSHDRQTSFYDLMLRIVMHHVLALLIIK